MQDVRLTVIHVLSRYLHIEIRSVILTRRSIGSKLAEGLQRGIENHVERDADAIAMERILLAKHFRRK
jgi:hypothetical protein